MLRRRPEVLWKNIRCACQIRLVCQAHPLYVEKHMYLLEIPF